VNGDYTELEHACRHHEVFVVAIKELLRASAPGLMEAIVARTPQADITAAEKFIVETARRLADRAYPMEAA